MKFVLSIAASTFLLTGLASAGLFDGPDDGAPDPLYNNCRCRGPVAKGASQGPDMPDKTKLACQHYNDGTYRNGIQAYVAYDESAADCKQNGASLTLAFWDEVCKKDGAASGQCWNEVAAPGFNNCRCRGPAPKGQISTQGPDLPDVTRQACTEYNGKNHDGWTATVAYHDPSDECRSDNGSLSPDAWDLVCKADGGATGQCWNN